MNFLKKTNIIKVFLKRKRLLIYGGLISALLLAFFFLFAEALGYYLIFRENKKARYVSHNKSEISILTPEGLREIEQERNTLFKKNLEKLRPNKAYLVIDTANNILYHQNEQTTILKAVISSGSGKFLAEPNGQRTWIFNTPRGEFEIKYKTKQPLWIKPDWAFIEEGKNLPEEFEERVEPGVLGKYALGFGQGYFIHGTLYTRLLGRNVTHGCIRMKDEDLENIYKSVSIGTKIFIF